MDFDRIYEMIAQKYGITRQEVKDEMNKALIIAWENENKSIAVEGKQRELSPSGETPTPEDFIGYIANNILYEQD